MLNCVKCGTPLFRVNNKENTWFCPNHGIIIENQDWNSLEWKKVNGGNGKYGDKGRPKKKRRKVNGN